MTLTEQIQELKLKLSEFNSYSIEIQNLLATNKQLGIGQLLIHKCSDEDVNDNIETYEFLLTRTTQQNGSTASNQNVLEDEKNTSYGKTTLKEIIYILDYCLYNQIPAVMVDDFDNPKEVLPFEYSINCSTDTGQNTTVLNSAEFGV